MAGESSPRAVIIGSGMAGLTSAILLQRQGYHVTVLEQHYRPGGMLHRFHRPKAKFDTGFHYCGGIDKGQALGQCLRHLGVFDDLEFHPLDPNGFDRLRFPDLEFRVPRSWQAYQQRLVETFPHEADGIDALLKAMRAAADLYGLYRMRPGLDLAALMEVESTSLDVMMNRYVSDRRLKGVLSAQGVLYGTAPAEAPFGVHSLVLDHFLDGAWTLAGGGDALARALTRKIRENGGAVHLRAEVTGIEVADRNACAVHTADEQRYAADWVFSNLHPRLTLELLPQKSVRKAYRTRVSDHQVGHSHMGVYLTVDGPVSEIGAANIYRYESYDTSALGGHMQPGSVPFYFATAPTEHSPQRRPGPSSVLMVLPMSWEQVAPWAHTKFGERPQAYLDFKAAHVQMATDALLADFPSLRGRILSVEGSTPLSTQHFTRSPSGAVYGHRHTLHQMGRNRPMSFIRVRNLALVGQGVGLPGVLGVTLSAYYAIGRIFGASELVRELRSA